VLILEKYRLKDGLVRLHKNYYHNSSFLRPNDRHIRVKAIIQNLSWLFGVSGISIANRMKDLEIYDSPSNIQKFFLDGKPCYYPKEFSASWLKIF